MTKEAMKLAIKALNTPRPSDSYPPLWRTYENTINTAIKALEEALKQEQEYEVLAGIGKGVEIPAGWKYYYIKPKLPLQQKQEQDEPVAYVNDQYSRDGYNDEISKLLPVGTYLYTKPQTKEWVGLNGADWNDFNPLLSNDPHRVADWVEKILKERNT